LYLIQAGTTSTPQNCYQDSGLTLPWPNPITLDSAGRIPQLFCADGSIKVRLTNSAGVQQLVQDNLLVVGPSGGGGGGGSVDPTTIAATGDLKAAYGTSVLTGWVRANGRTIGSSTSGATERANADCQALFEYLWGADANLAVSGGRGASAAADWAANKTITLPDSAGRAIAGLDDMGAGAKGRLTTTYFGTATNVLGAAGGAESRTLTAAQLPANIPFSLNATLSASGFIGSGINGTLLNPGGTNIPVTTVALSATAPVSGSVNSTGGAAHATVSPMILATIYLKL
jgi:microcystin-dependent protein